ncbi:hypothetical protein J8281_14950 [Aquimarina sp. U1-2]|uniref:hypothetical protein n=1 Tax=Aquimarina sp. U1-2 TaxID=2823141 RepID=UPI001AECF7EC|nr:hypothetical protein [Aquimarina sp. U1-2]MBP2833491.1 hypothetical protein [Aquimarina sp. U1-2]
MEAIQKTHEYQLDKYTFQEPYETITAVDKAVLDILSYNYKSNINANSGNREKLQLILSFLKIENIFKEFSIKKNIKESTYTELRGKSGYAVLDTFLIIQLTSDHADKYQIYEGYKKFIDYMSDFEEELKTNYESQNKQVARKWKRKQEQEFKEADREVRIISFIFLILITLVFIYGC